MAEPLPYASAYHAPVMVREVLAHLAPERAGIFLDGTLGGGGHAEALLDASEGARLVGVDRDPDALARAGARLARFGERVRLVRANYAAAIDAAGIAPGSLVGVLLDLGISSHQVDAPERGFTFRGGASLDMRMGKDSEGEPSAADLLNEASEAELAEWFFRFAEERRARKLARVLTEMRARAPIVSSEQMVDAIRRTLGPGADASDNARIFQALRIVVNREIESLEAALPAFRDALAPSGVLVVLAYHSLEDRVVKNTFREWSQSCVCPPALPVCRCRGAALGVTLTRKGLVADEAEVRANPRARSARLRAWRRA